MHIHINMCIGVPRREQPRALPLRLAKQSPVNPITILTYVRTHTHTHINIYIPRRERRHALRLGLAKQSRAPSAKIYNNPIVRAEL